MDKVFVVGTVDRVVHELARDAVGDGPAMLEAALRQALATGLDSVGVTAIKGPHGMTIAASIEAQQSTVGIGIDVAVCTADGNFWCRVEECDAKAWTSDDLSEWARGAWEDAVAAIIGEICARTVKKLSEQPRRSNGVFHP